MSSGRPSAVTLFVTVPTTLAPGHVSASNCACVHFVAAFGLPTRPGGRWTVRFLRLSLAPEKTVSSVRLGWPPACGFDGVTVKVPIPSAVTLPAARTGWPCLVGKMGSPGAAGGGVKRVVAPVRAFNRLGGSEPTGKGRGDGARTANRSLFRVAATLAALFPPAGSAV